VLRIATRGSPLARLQAGIVAGLLAASGAGDPEFVVVRTEGDRRDEPIDRIGGQGLFVKEVQEAVLAGRADLAVHSAKDLPPGTPEGLVVAAVPPRADPRDGLVGRRLADLAPGAVVATGAARRRAQLANVRPDLTFVDLRGNMEKRVARARRAESPDGDVDAVVVAVAALERLGWMDRLAEILPLSVMLSQVGQGALAVECRADDEATRAALNAVDDPVSHRCLRAERALLGAVAGDCSMPVGALARSTEGDQTLSLEAMAATGDGRVLMRARLRGDDPEQLGRQMAVYLQDECGASLVQGWRLVGDAAGA